MPDVFPCRSCGCLIRLIYTESFKRTPVAAGAIEPTMRPLPEGKYFDENGRYYTDLNAPADRVLYRSHFELCTGANKHRKRNARR